MMSESSYQKIPKVYLAKGEYLFRTGDEADYAYLVEEGRLLVFHEGEDGEEMPIAEIGPHELAG